MNTRNWLLILIVLSLFAAVPAMATLAMKSGDYFLLRGNSGKYLSAWPNEELRMSPNTAAWEEWQYIDEGGGLGRIQSFHGTVLAVVTASDPHRFIHGPWFVPANEQQLMRPTPEQEGPAPDKITLRYGSSRSQYFGDPETGGVVWTVVPCTPAGGRSVLKKGVDGYGSSLELISAHGTYLKTGLDIPNTQGRAAIHKAGKGGCGLSKNSFGTIQRQVSPLRFGDTVYFGCGGYNLHQRKNPSGTERLMMHYYGTDAGTSGTWTIFDPTGTYKTGEIVRYGAVVALRQGTLHPSADPAYPDVQLSPNTAGWERWTITEP